MKDLAAYTTQVDGLAMVPFWLLEKRESEARRRSRRMWLVIGGLAAALIVALVWR